MERRHDVGERICYLVIDAGLVVRGPKKSRKRKKPEPSEEDTQQALSDLLSFYGLESIWDNNTISAPPLENWIQNPKRKFIKKTLGISSQKEKKNTITIIRWILRHKLGLNLRNYRVRKRSKGSIISKQVYWIDPESQRILSEKMKEIKTL